MISLTKGSCGSLGENRLALLGLALAPLNLSTLWMRVCASASMLQSKQGGGDRWVQLVMPVFRRRALPLSGLPSFFDLGIVRYYVPRLPMYIIFSGVKKKNKRSTQETEREKSNNSNNNGNSRAVNW